MPVRPGTRDILKRSDLCGLAAPLRDVGDGCLR
jgi:hypothetical protein